MRIDGVWLFCDDGMSRPVFWAEVECFDGRWVQFPLLADCGADRTVISQDVFAAIGRATTKDQDALAGIGGKVGSVTFGGRIRVPNQSGAMITFRGEFAAFISQNALEMSLLGRDITNNFALIVDRPSDTVCLLSRGEVYQA